MVPVVTELAPNIPPITRMLSGRLHALALDERGRLWTWANWAEAALVSSSWLDYSQHRIVDIAAGWTFSAVLLEDRKTKRRSTHVWWQRFLSPTLQNSTRGHAAPDQVPDARPVEGNQGCFHFDPLQAIALPDLPNISEGDRIQKLAAGESFLIALTSQGKVYKLDLSAPQLPLWAGNQSAVGVGALLPALDPEEDDTEDGRMLNRSFSELERQIMIGQKAWMYLEKFSEFQDNNVDSEKRATEEQEDRYENSGPSKKRISFVSANFRTFFCIGDGAVLQGHQDVTEETDPLVKPELQNRGVIR